MVKVESIFSFIFLLLPLTYLSQKRPLSGSKMHCINTNEVIQHLLEQTTFVFIYSLIKTQQTA